MANKFEQTKGYVFLVGKVFGIDGKAPYNNGSKNTLSIRVNTDKDNTVFATVGSWCNSSMAVKLKPQGMEQADEIPMGEVADVLQDYFHDGDSVLVRGSVDVNTYKEGRLDVLVNGIYACSEEVDFESEKFEERNEINISGIVAGEIKDGQIPVMFVNYKGETLTKELTAENEVIKEFLGKVNEGDLIPFTISMINKPIYEVIVEDVKDEPERKTLLGKTTGGGKQKQKRTIVGNINLLVIQDIDVEKIETKKYKLEQQETPDMPF